MSPRADYMREYMRTWRRRHGARDRDWLQRLILATLRAHPAGLRVLPLLARIGYRTGTPTVYSTIHLLRRRGVPVVGVREGCFVRYRLLDQEERR